MAGWQSKIAAYDRQSLVDLTSVGLVRRAEKQVAAGAVRPVPDETTDSQGVFSVADQTVVLPDGPLTDARCDCRAMGICMHILAAVNFAQSTAPDSNSETPATTISKADIEAEMSIHTPDAIFKWAGKTALRQALQLLSRLPEADRSITTGDASLALALGEAVRCRYVPGAGLDGIICEAPDHRRKGVIAACLLYWWQQRGHDIQWPEDLAGNETAATALSDDERQLTMAVQAQLSAMLQAGLMHQPRHLEDALRDLAWSAQGNRLPRLSALLLQLVGELTAFRNGRAGAESQQILDRMATVYLLCEALNRSPIDAMATLRGQFRRDYIARKVGPLWMTGAYRYQTRSAAKGLTIVLWDLKNNTPLRVNIGRTGEAAKGFDPASVWRQSLGWQKGRSPEDMNNMVIRLENAKVSNDGRISLSAETGLKSIEAVNGDIEAIENIRVGNWKQLCRQLSLALQAPQPALQPIMVRPRRVSAMVLDEIGQCWIGRLQDDDRQWLNVTLPVDDLHNSRAALINKCISVAKNDIQGVLLEPRLFQQQLQLLPVSIIVQTKNGLHAFHPDLTFLDFTRQLKLSTLLKRVLPRLPDGKAEALHQDDALASLDSLTAGVLDMILGAAEVGLSCPYTDPEQISRFTTDLKSANAPQLADLVQRLGRRNECRPIVQAYYAFQLARRKLQIERLIHVVPESP